MTKSHAFAAAVLRHALHGEPLPAIGPDVYLSFHTADPSAGDQATGEVAYDGYARVPVPQGAEHWPAEGAIAHLAGKAFFPVCRGGRCVATHWGLGTAAEGPGFLLWAFPLSEPLEIFRPVEPYLTPDTAVSEG